MIHPPSRSRDDSAARPRPAALLPGVIDAVTVAGEMIRAEFHRPGGPRGRGGSAPVDSEIECHLRDRLLGMHACGFVGEETGRVASPSGDIWVVDPQDGTRDFLAGRRGSAVSVALLRAGRPVLGVVSAPLAPDDGGDLISWAEGAALTRNGAPARRTAVSDAPVIALNANAADHARHNHATLPGVRIRALPSPAYRLALAAAGEVDAAVSFIPGLEHWDIAGGHALLIGAGGTLVDLSGRPVDYARGCLDGCIGGAPAAVERLVALAPRHGPREPRGEARPRGRIADPGRLARAQGCLLGQLAGDALGSAVEFRGAADIARTHPGGVTRLTDGGTWTLIAGQPTDDGEMALALARALIEGQGFDRDLVARAYIDWKGSNPFDIGTTTTRGIDALRDRGGPNPASQANGALMRVAPIGIAAAGRPEVAAAWADLDAGLTHPHPVCRSASAAFSAAVAAGVAGADPHAMWAVAHAHAGEGAGATEIRQCLIEAREAPPPDFARHQGWVLTAFGNAFHRLWIGQPFAEALVETVMAGGDTDTNAAICGALLGAAEGRDAIPPAWRAQVLSCRAVAGRGVVHPRPADYWADDALELAEALLGVASRGRPFRAPKTRTPAG